MYFERKMCYDNDIMINAVRLKDRDNAVPEVMIGHS